MYHKGTKDTEMLNLLSQSYPGREEESRLQSAKALTPLYDSKRLASV